MRRQSQEARTADQQRPRRRRTAKEARHEILEVAIRHLIKGGPDAIRLHAIASEIGVTHQAILRHFRTRDQLMASLLRHAGKSLREELSMAVTASQRNPVSVRKFYEAIDQIYRRRGYARLSAGLVLKGWTPTGSGFYREAAEAIHRGRREAGEAARRPVLEDTLFSVVLLTLGAWADALIGAAARRAVDLPDDEVTAQRFRVWFANLVGDHLFQTKAHHEKRGFGPGSRTTIPPVEKEGRPGPQKLPVKSKARRMT